MKTLSYLLIPALCLAGCAGTGSRTVKHDAPAAATVSVIRPMKGLGIAPRTFTVSADRADRIDLPNGGHIRFPEHAFVDRNGNPVSGNVTVEWQEFHSLADILVSGIPMEYDSAGVENHFISGGMFTIAASQNGREIELAPGKEADVALATYDEQRQFNFYGLNETTGQWSYRETALSTPNPDYKAEAPAAASAKTASGEIKHIFLDVAASYPDSIDGLAGKDIVGWNVQRSEVPQKLQRTIAGEQWDARITGKTPAGYTLELKNRKTALHLQATPVTMDDALAATKTVETRTGQRWKDLMAFQQQEKDAKMIRTASIPGFGTYNWDYVHQRESPVVFALDLEIPGKNADVAEIYHVCPEERSIIRYSSDDFSRFSFDPDKGNCIVAIFPDKTVYTVSDKQFDAARNQKGAREFTFNMQSRPERFTSGGQLGRLVDKLI